MKLLSVRKMKNRVPPRLLTAGCRAAIMTTERTDGNCMRHKRRLVRFIALAACIGLVTGCSSSEKTTKNDGASGSSSNASGKTIKLGLLTSVTGSAASTFGESTVSAARAAISLANDSNELPDGAKLELVVGDDQSTPAGALASVKDMVQRQHVFAILSASSAFYGAQQFTTQQNIPVLGASFDPSWADPKNKNLFAMWGSASGDYPSYEGIGDYFKEKGGTSFCGIGVQAPSAVGAAKALAASAKLSGLTVPYLNVSLPFAATDFTSVALSMKSAGCDVVGGQLLGPQAISLIQALSQLGVKLKASLMSGGYSPSILTDPNIKQAVQGWGFARGSLPEFMDVPAMERVHNALAKYTGSPEVGLGFQWGWYPAELAVKAIQVAGSNASQADLIEKLHGVTDFDFDGLSCAVDYSRAGTVPSIVNSGCLWIAVAMGDKFVSATGANPIKMTLIPGTKNN